MEPLIGLQIGAISFADEGRRHRRRPRFFDLMVDELERVFAGYRPRFPLLPRTG